MKICDFGYILYPSTRIFEYYAPYVRYHTIEIHMCDPSYLLQVRGGKFWKLYKRPGHRVIINSDGDLIVRPTFIEASIQRRSGGSSVAQHLLASYQKSYIAVIKAQFSSKGFLGGQEVSLVPPPYPSL